jgi:hypothetical protein
VPRRGGRPVPRFSWGKSFLVRQILKSARVYDLLLARALYRGLIPSIHF